MIVHSKTQHNIYNLIFYRCTQGDTDSDNLYVAGVTELFNAGYSISDTRHTYNNYTGSIICKLNHEFIGGIFYKDDTVQLHKMLAVTLTYVIPSFRKQGLFKLLHKQLDIILKEQNLKGCLSWQSIHNTAMSYVKSSVGYKEVMILHKRNIIDNI